MPPSSAEHRRQKYQERKDAGLCTNCGKERDGTSVSLCARCQIRQRDAVRRYDLTHRGTRKVAHRTFRQQKHARRRQSGLCILCGQAKPLPGLVRCPRCHARQAEAKFRCNEKRRRKRFPRYNGDPKTYPYSLGKEHIRKLDGGANVTVHLDGWAYLATARLLKDVRDREWADGQIIRRDRVSRIIRQQILNFRGRTCPCHRQTDEKFAYPLQIRLCARTLTHVDAHAAHHYNGNRSQALRDFLIAARLHRKWVAKVGGTRRYPDIDDRKG